MGPLSCSSFLQSELLTPYWRGTQPERRDGRLPGDGRSRGVAPRAKTRGRTKRSGGTGGELAREAAGDRVRWVAGEGRRQGGFTCL